MQRFSELLELGLKALELFTRMLLSAQAVNLLFGTDKARVRHTRQLPGRRLHTCISVFVASSARCLVLPLRSIAF